MTIGSSRVSVNKTRHAIRRIRFLGDRGEIVRFQSLTRSVTRFFTLRKEKSGYERRRETYSLAKDAFKLYGAFKKIENSTGRRYNVSHRRLGLFFFLSASFVSFPRHDDGCW